MIENGGRIDLDRARREAKKLLAAARAGDETALARLRGKWRVRLADAQRAVARELGEASWPRLVRRVEAEAVAREDRARQLVQEATDGRRDHAEALLALDPDPARRSRRALVLGEAERVRAALARGPGLVARPLGAREWLPLLCPCHSAFLGGDGPRGWSTARGRCWKRAPTRTRAGSTPSSARSALSMPRRASRTSRA